MKPIKLMSLAITSLSLGLTLAGNAHADAYALSYDNIFNGTVTATSANVIFDFVNSPSVPTSSASAALNGVGVSFGGAGFTDAPVANAPGSAPLQSNNSFTPLGMVGTYSNADAQIISQQESATTSIHAVNIAEGYLAGNGSTVSNGINSSATQFQIGLNVGPAGDALVFDFNADPYMKVFLGASSLGGSKAEAGLNMTITISNSAGDIVFSWAPNGVVDGITGGTEVADEANLNLSISQLLPGTKTFNPTGDASFGPGIPSLFKHFNAVTDTLIEGTYSLTLAMGETQSLINRVPEPATALLLGAGLLGMSFGRRNKS